MKITPSKQKVIDAASSLFFQKGFHGTSVRDIAEKADMNVSSVSYYFKGKQGLLEHAITNYYEEYLTVLVEQLEKTTNDLPLDRLNGLISTIIHYKQSKHQLSCFIQRELTLDSIFVREMSVTYLAKENHLLHNLFYQVLAGKKFRGDSKSYLFMQFKGMLITPYITHNEWKDQVIGVKSHQIFAEKYAIIIQKWVRFIGEKENYF